MRLKFGKCPVYRGDSAEISQKVPVFSERVRHRGDVRNSKGFVSDYEKIRGGSFHFANENNNVKQSVMGKVVREVFFM
ncbi:cyclic nucleotide gated channel 1 [Prunus dulcis]|uniref:Cyclic nucleotide gated channel 1 n=1 Tax=Prunus dulcis TaxID=3755 RepID=A0A4Y1R863_PRUDU|nr:cyclic nucleotide gated channel 1 [Prunus dulcis]